MTDRLIRGLIANTVARAGLARMVRRFDQTTGVYMRDNVGTGWTRPQAARACAWFILGVIPACNGTLPSARLQRRVDLPIPTSASSEPPGDRLSTEFRGETQELSPQSVIRLAFDLQPEIKSSYQRFKSEEARYDFFYVSRDSLTPGLRVTNEFGESRAEEDVTRSRTHTVELSVEKRFFDTTELKVGTGFKSAETDTEDSDIGDHPFVSASLRYPLWVSREKLGRTSEEIFRQNELNDTQLDYIETVRWGLQNAMFKFYDVAHLARRNANYESWQADLLALQERVETLERGEVSTDLSRLQAEIAKVSADLRIAVGWYEIQVGRLKANIGLPFHSRVEISDGPFNPFEGMSHEEVLRASIATDPEIATLRNAVRNAEVQLDLARRGKWDLTFLLSGQSSLEGRGADEGVSDWSVSAGLDVSAVDSRVTDSLIRQAEANIHRFAQAIASRENTIFVDTLESLVRLDTLGASRDELIGNLPRYEDDYRTGVEAYFASELNIDDLVKRRETIFNQQDQISNLTYLLGANVAELCRATGKFFELLGQSPAG